MTDHLRLLTDQEIAEAGPPEAVRLPLELIDPNPANPRVQLAELAALADNIRTFGLLQPVTVRRRDDRYELLGGHRRTAAFARLRDAEPLEPQWRTIPAVVRTEQDDDQAYLMLISGQVHSKGWTPREEAAALERLVLAGRNLAQIGGALQRTEAWASKRLRVYADAVLSGYVQTGRLNTGVAEELLSIRDPEVRRQLADAAVTEGWSQDQTRSQVRAHRLDRQVAELGRRGLELLDILSRVNGRDVPIDTFRNLMVLRGRLETFADEARGAAPHIPTIEEAQRAAGVSDRPRRAQRTQARRKPGYKPKY